jgi:hypothetical protein
MSQDNRSPYAAPAAKVADPAPRPGSPYKAVAFGALTDLGGTFVFSIGLAFLNAMFLAASGTPPEEIAQAIQSGASDSWYFWAATIGGGGFSVLGAYVCARIARQSEYTLGAILAVIDVVFGLVVGDGERELGMSILLNAATIASVILGAWLGKKKNRRPSGGTA